MRIFQEIGRMFPFLVIQSQYKILVKTDNKGKYLTLQDIPK